MAGPSSAPTRAAEHPLRRAAERFAQVVCPPQVREGNRTARVLREFGLMVGALPPAARFVLLGALTAADHGARLYPPARGRRLSRLDDAVASAYVGALLAGNGNAAGIVRRLKSVMTMCYYELPEVQREIGYDPVPYIAAVAERRLRSYGPQIRAAGITGPGRPPAAGPR